MEEINLEALVKALLALFDSKNGRIYSGQTFGGGMK